MSSFMSLLNHSDFFPSDLFRSYEGTLNKSYQGSNNLMLVDNIDNNSMRLSPMDNSSEDEITLTDLSSSTYKNHQDGNKSSSPDFMDSDSSSSYKTNQSLEAVTKKSKPAGPKRSRSAKSGSSAKERSKGVPRCPPSQPGSRSFHW
ncbi:hypothetical protein CDAR_74902 [Caerostris darwini]|uniref:Uncharacterized protein n=1 Tax=Caerostris darwini TaxID=1538125 RepID=A0AAV4P456_9ARAC|nr:hypothetical protein CDAR_74902 [Caerostris darwini]